MRILVILLLVLRRIRKLYIVWLLVIVQNQHLKTVLLSVQVVIRQRKIRYLSGQEALTLLMEMK